METVVRDSLPILLPIIRELVAFSIAATLRSFYFVRRTYPDPASGVAIGAFALGCIVLLWRGDAAARRAGIAMAVLCTGVYAVIAAGRATFFDPKVALSKTVGQLRYHYLGALPIVVLTCLALRERGRIGGCRVRCSWWRCWSAAPTATRTRRSKSTTTCSAASTSTPRCEASRATPWRTRPARPCISTTATRRPACSVR